MCTREWDLISGGPDYKSGEGSTDPGAPLL